MVELDKLRITKLKCLSCGSRDKRVSILGFGPKNERIGFTTTCCNCGETKKYVFREKKKDPINNRALVTMNEGRCHVTDIFCAIPHPFCDKKECSLYNRCVKGKDLTYKDLKNENYKIESVSRIDADIRDFMDEKIEKKRFF